MIINLNLRFQDCGEEPMVVYDRNTDETITEITPYIMYLVIYKLIHQ
jgi:hypothetical protein